MNRYKAKNTTALFLEDYRLRKLTKQGDPLERLDGVINWEFFRETIEQIYENKMVKAGPKPYDPLLMFKILILQRYYNLAEGQLEFQILDRLTFCRFLGLSLNDTVPDEKTIWNFRDLLIKKGLEKQLFNKFKDLLDTNGLIAQEGKIVDASFVVAPRQRNGKEKNKEIKEGKTPNEWADNPNKLRQKDVDDRWTKKNNENYFGYKNHIKVDAKYKFIETYTTTSASVHDSQTLDELLTEKDNGQELWADSDYTGKKQEKTLKKYKVKSHVHQKGTKANKLTEEQIAGNKGKSSTRARVEHVFGFIEQSMNKLYIRSIGIKRAEGFVALVNLTYNLFRYEQIVRLDRKGVPLF